MGLVKVINNRDSRVVIARPGTDEDKEKRVEMVLESGANNVDPAELKKFRVKGSPGEQFF